MSNGSWHTAGGKLTNNNRHEFDTVVKILKAASKGAKKKELHHRSGLKPAIFGKYVAAMIELDLLDMKPDLSYYKTTEKGLELLHIYHKLRWLLWGGTFDFMLVGLLGRLKMDRTERIKYNAYIS
jgi:predicted transcriptional regulator